MPVPLLVLTDFSPAAYRALNYANSLAGPIGAQLVLLHVRRDSLLDPEAFSGLRAAGNPEALERAMTALAGDMSAPVVTEIRHGQVADVVAETLRRYPSAVVVLGRPDEEAVPEELVSTTALDLLRTVAHPILVVPQSKAVFGLPRRVLLAVDAEAFTLGEHTDGVQHLFNTVPTEVTVLHVSADAVTSTAEAVAPAALVAVLRTGRPSELPQVKTRTVVGVAPAEGILEAAATGAFDLLVLIARPRSFLGALFHRSVTARVLIHSPLPVLILPVV